MEKGHSFECNTTQRLKAVSEVGPGDVYGVLSDFKLSAPAEGYFLSSRVLRQMFAKYYFNNPTPRTSPFPNPRKPLVSVSSRSGRIRKWLPQLHVCVFRLVTMVRVSCTRSLCRLNLLDILLRHNALVGGHPGPWKKADEQPLLLLVDKTIEGASPSHARQE